MKTHREIDERSLALARAVAAKIDADPRRLGLIKAREVLQLWEARDSLPVYREWRSIIEKSWPEVRRVLCDEGERGKRLRQSDPFCGILKPQERWAIYKRFGNGETQRS
jgi:hypothetical protein